MTIWRTTTRGSRRRCGSAMRTSSLTTSPLPFSLTIRYDNRDIITILLDNYKPCRCIILKLKQNGIVCDVLSMSHIKENIMQLENLTPHTPYKHKNIYYCGNGRYSSLSWEKTLAIQDVFCLSDCTKQSQPT